MPRWMYGTSCSTSPVGPIVPTIASSPTVSPRRTLVEPRCVRVTEYPSAVWIVTTLPLTGTVPANETRPDAGARTGSPAAAPMSIPRCWPAAYGSSPRTNFCSTGPLTGQVHAPAVGTITRAAASTTIRARRICFSLLSFLPTEITIPGVTIRCQYGLQGRVVKALARQPCETRDDRGGLAAGDPRGDELRDRLGSRGHVRRLPFTAGPEHERDLTLRRLGKFLRELAGAATHDLLVPFCQLAADGQPTVRIHRGERAQRRRQPARGLEGDRRPGPPTEVRPRPPEGLFAPWQEADELVALGCKTARDQRGVDGGGTG